MEIFLISLGGLLSSKAKRAKCSTHKQRVIVMLYNKVCDIVSSLSELLEIQLLTDTTILQVSFIRRVSVVAFCCCCFLVFSFLRETVKHSCVNDIKHEIKYFN